ncbi:hypothetical protein WICPIJ_002292 [Wickerhamomyces pijperi]|uniref:Uncharacterized protein n=1 Tax=Wickerhamomyces pijperi TaxID=599730 RepID=A0A9P8QC37_WICPI|nr:hypothetical protein WICPIJ_002292 [Wickerhamomyces pijperi]
MKKSAASKPCAALILTPSGSRPVSGSSIICFNQQALSRTIVLKDQDSIPVEMTPGTITIGCFEVNWYSDFMNSPTLNDSVEIPSLPFASLAVKLAVKSLRID